jgi:hypothetical protein
MAISADVKQQALSAVAAVKPEIQAAEKTGDTTATASRASLTPNAELASKTAERLATMEKSGYDSNARIQAMSKDDFVR